MNSAIPLPLRLSYSNLYSPKRRRPTSLVPAILSVLRTSQHVSEFAGDEVLEAFIKEREVTGDFIAKVSDRIWLKEAIDSLNTNSQKTIAADFSDNTPQLSEQEVLDENEGGGFLKLKRTNEWVLGDTLIAPVNKKMSIKELQNDGEKRRKLNLLRYEALKRELLLLTAGIGTACGGYCLVVLSVQAALSYGIGVLFSCLYFQLLCQHADNLSKEKVPDIFMQKKSKKIGIRSEDLQDLFERSIKGTGLALSSPRLVIPAAIYGLWELSQHFAHDLLDFQLVPAMLGIFAYKAAALVQVYRDNEDLQFIFPENEERSGN
ncbi:unnamed protein product [Coffea canephora]|uniref:Uncharacterized protein n=1 Tax=Coffea canephora TaxID=49390 RepID=A0A068UF18_COFCA|nr:unnamed protein product [Coffea canephora]